MTITISAITVSMLTTNAAPGLISLILFILLLGIIEVGAVGVPGGSIMAAWPVLVGVLGFQEQAMGLMFALFLIQDSFGTAANITGDASIAMIVNKKFGDFTDRKASSRRQAAKHPPDRQAASKLGTMNFFIL